MSPGPDRGKPALRVRLEPELIDRAQVAFPPVKGRSGGVALALRRLLHLALDVAMPSQYGEIGRAKGIDALEARLRELLALPFDDGQATALRLDARRLLSATEDAVDVLRLRALLGRLHLWETPLEPAPKKS